MCSLKSRKQAELSPEPKEKHLHNHTYLHATLWAFILGKFAAARGTQVINTHCNSMAPAEVSGCCASVRSERMGLFYYALASPQREGCMCVYIFIPFRDICIYKGYRFKFFWKEHLKSNGSPYHLI